MPDLDLIDLLEADHSNLQRDIMGQGEVGGTESVEKHLTVERALLYPAIVAHLVDGRGTADRLRAIDTRLIDSLSRSNSGSVDEAAAVLQEHVTAQEAVFLALRQHVPVERLVELGDSAPLVMAEAPSHFHSDLPDHGVLREAASEIAAEVDRVRDALHGDKGTD